jgi:hypothetical protein
MDLIVGGGKYGCEAIELLRYKDKNFIVVDTDPNCLAVTKFKIKTSSNFESNMNGFVKGDLSTVMKLIDQIEPEYVFPTAPIHIAADMAKIKFNLKPWSEPLCNILSKVPSSVVLLAGKGKIILSFNRDNDCIEKCSMPKICPSSQVKKPCTMTELIKFASPDAFILISYSMAPGIGALKGSEILGFFKWVEMKEKFIVATACDCHGVLNAFQK